MGGDSCYLAVLCVCVCVCVYVLLDCVVCVNLFFMASTNSKIVTLAVELVTFVSLADFW